MAAESWSTIAEVAADGRVAECRVHYRMRRNEFLANRLGQVSKFQLNVVIGVMRTGRWTTKPSKLGSPQA